VIPPYRVAAAAPRAAPGGHRHRGRPRRRGPPTNSGDAAPREALFLAAHHARRADPSLAARYYRLMVSQGKHHNSALCHSSAALLTRYRSHAWAAALAATATTHKRTRPYTPQPSGSTARWPRMGLRPRLHHRSERITALLPPGGVSVRCADARWRSCARSPPYPEGRYARLRLVTNSRNSSGASW
jgi:hypothetical protein